MKILFLQKSTDWGGSKSSLCDTLDALRAHVPGVEAEVVCSGPGQLLGELEKRQVPHSLFALPEWRKWSDRLRFGSSLRRLARAYSGKRIDCVVSNEFWWAPHAAALAEKLGCGSAAIIRDGSATARKALQYRLDRLGLIVSLSQRISRQMEADERLASRTRIVYDAVSLPASGGARRAELQARLAEKPGIETWLLCLGSVGFRKNQTAALQTLAELHRQGFTRTGLVFAGEMEPGYEETFQQALTESGLAHAVVLLGHFNDIESLFAETVLSILTSLREGCPRSIVETLSSGRPAFAWEVEGTSDIFGSDENRFVSKPDAAALAAKIAAYLRGPQDYAAEIAALKERVEKLFSPAAHARNLVAVLPRT